MEMTKHISKGNEEPRWTQESETGVWTTFFGTIKTQIDDKAFHGGLNKELEAIKCQKERRDLIPEKYEAIRVEEMASRVLDQTREGEAVKESEASNRLTEESITKRSEAKGMKDGIPESRDEYRDLKGERRSAVQQVSEPNRKLPIRKAMLEATLDGKQALASEIFSSMWEKQRDAEKIIADLRSRTERIKADNFKLMAEIGDANVEADEINLRVKAMEVEEQAMSSALASQKLAEEEDKTEVCKLESQLKWREKELLQLRQDRQLKEYKNKILQQQAEAKQEEISTLSYELEDVKQAQIGSEEMKALKENEIKLQKEVDSNETCNKLFKDKIDEAYKISKEKGKRIKNMKEEYNKMSPDCLKKAVSVAGDFLTMKEDIQIAVETLGEQMALLQSTIEERCLREETKLSGYLKQIQTVRTQLGARK